MNKIETVEDFNNFMLGLIEKQERKAGRTTKLNQKPKAKSSNFQKAKVSTKSNAGIMADLKRTEKKFRQMGGVFDREEIATVPNSGYDPLKAKNARLSKKNELPNLKNDKDDLRRGKKYRTSAKPMKSGYDPDKVKNHRLNREDKFHGEGPGRSKVVSPKENEDRYDPERIKFLRAQKKAKENE